MRKRSKQYMQGLLDGILFGFLDRRKLTGEVNLSPEDEALYEWLRDAVIEAIVSDDDEVVSVSVRPGTREVIRAPANPRRREGVWALLDRARLIKRR